MKAKIVICIIFLVILTVNVKAQSLTILNTSHDYSITKIEISIKYSDNLLKVTDNEKDIIWDEGLTTTRQIVGRSSIKYPEITKGGRFIRITWENNFVVKKFIKHTKDTVLKVGGQNDGDDWK